MRPAISIDLGSAYTKIGFRETPSTRSRLLGLGELSLDDHHVCIPSVAAWRETDDRWAFGIDAIDLVQGNGIHVFRNWKPHLFPVNEADYTRPQEAEATTTELLEDKDSYLAARTIANKFLSWLRQDIVPRMLPETDLDDTTLRLCIPEFSMFTDGAADLERLLEEQGWFNALSYCCSEPMANLTGALTQGHNAILEPEPGKFFADIPAMFEPSHILEMVKAYHTNRETDGSEYATLIVDVGAYTTDFGLISIDLSGSGFFPISETYSEPLGIFELDRRVREALPPEQANAVAHLSSRELERFHRVIYSEARAWEIPGVGVIGATPEERARIGNVMSQFAHEIGSSMDRFIDTYRPPRIQEVILTGGGNNISEVGEYLRHRVAQRGVATFYAPSPSQQIQGTTEVAIHPSVVRGASAMGGSSVLFDLS